MIDQAKRCLATESKGDRCRFNPRRVLVALAAAGAAGFLPFAHGAAISREGGEYPVIGSLSGDQVMVQLALNEQGGFVVWQDNIADGDGMGIAARRLDRNFAGIFNVIRVNAQGAGDQERPQVAMLKNGGAAFVWQGGPKAARVSARFLAADATFITDDVQVSAVASLRQEDPQVAALSDGNVIVVWTSYGQDGSHDGILARRFSPAGQPLGDEFQVTETTLLNQRNATVAALPNRRFAIVWVSERLTGYAPNVDETGRNPEGLGGAIPTYDVSVFGRLFGPEGPEGGEFKVNTTPYTSANPSVTALPDGRFAVAWSSRVGRYEVSGVTAHNGWDIMARVFSANGQPAGVESRLNEVTFGDQFLPRLSVFGDTFLGVWTSLMQDGSGEGVVARLFSGNGEPVGSEFLVNTYTIANQRFPAVAGNGGGRALIAWSTTRGGLASFDLAAQRYTQGEQLSAPSKPFVSALSATRLSVTWPSLEGLNVSQYELYLDGASTAIAVKSNLWTSSTLAPGSTHTFQLAYVLADGRRSPLSEPATGKTWGADETFDGLPDDWQAIYWGTDAGQWPGARVDSDGDGADNLQEFLAGTDPTKADSVLKLAWQTTPLGRRLTWNTEKGFVYQVQVSPNGAPWQDVGTPRFAPGLVDSISATTDGGSAVYRLIRLR